MKTARPVSEAERATICFVLMLTLTLLNTFEQATDVHTGVRTAFETSRNVGYLLCAGLIAASVFQLFRARRRAWRGDSFSSVLWALPLLFTGIHGDGATLNGRAVMIEYGLGGPGTAAYVFVAAVTFVLLNCAMNVSGAEDAGESPIQNSAKAELTGFKNP